MNRLWERGIVSFESLDSIALWHSQRRHSIERPTAQQQLAFLSCLTARTQPFAKDGFEPHHSRFHQTPAVITAFLLPLSAAPVLVAPPASLQFPNPR